MAWLLSVKSKSKFSNFHLWKSILQCPLQMTTTFSQPQCIKAIWAPVISAPSLLPLLLIQLLYIHTNVRDCCYWLLPENNRTVLLLLLGASTNKYIPSGFFYWHGLTCIPAWIRNHMPSKVWDEITYPFPKFNGCTIEVWEWISIFSTLYNGCNY